MENPGVWEPGIYLTDLQQRSTPPLWYNSAVNR